MHRLRFSNDFGNATFKIGKNCSKKISPPCKRFQSDMTIKAPSIFQRYTMALEAHPLAVKSITSAIIAGIGDIGCQAYKRFKFSSETHSDDETSTSTEKQLSHTAETPKSFDWYRCAKFMFLGGCLFAPSVHVWYGMLVRLVPGRSLTTATKRMAMDQFLFAPILTGVFFSALMVLEGEAAKILDKLNQDYWSTLVANWTLWMPAQLLNFRLVPLRYQVLFANGVGLFWNFYLSSKCFKKLPNEPPISTLEPPLIHEQSSSDSKNLNNAELVTESFRVNRNTNTVKSQNPDHSQLSHSVSHMKVTTRKSV
jgi:hypothetical protein